MGERGEPRSIRSTSMYMQSTGMEGSSSRTWAKHRTGLRRAEEALHQYEGHPRATAPTVITDTARASMFDQRHATLRQSSVHQFSFHPPSSSPTKAIRSSNPWFLFESDARFGFEAHETSYPARLDACCAINMSTLEAK